MEKPGAGLLSFSWHSENLSLTTIFVTYTPQVSQNWQTQFDQEIVFIHGMLAMEVWHLTFLKHKCLARNSCQFQIPVRNV